MEQLNLWGELIDVDTIPKPSRKTKTMQEMFGVIEGKQCRTCQHCYQCRMSKTWYKCELWDNYFRGSSAASDIRLKHQACKKYVEDS